MTKYCVKAGARRILWHYSKYDHCLNARKNLHTVSVCAHIPFRYVCSTFARVKAWFSVYLNFLLRGFDKRQFVLEVDQVNAHSLKVLYLRSKRWTSMQAYRRWCARKRYSFTSSNYQSINRIKWRCVSESIWMRKSKPGSEEWKSCGRFFKIEHFLILSTHCPTLVWLNAEILVPVRKENKDLCVF